MKHKVTPNFSLRIGSPSIADRVHITVFLEATCFHPNCSCSASIYRHPFDDAPLEICVHPCVTNGPVHDRTILEAAVRAHWDTISNCAQDFVAQHECHPD
jgi:hypothetical protein